MVDRLTRDQRHRDQLSFNYSTVLGNVKQKKYLDKFIFGVIIGCIDTKKLIRELCPEQCIGCERREGDGYCTTYSYPPSWWRNGKTCPFHPRGKIRVKEDKDFKLNPLKASKRSMGK